MIHLISITVTVWFELLLDEDSICFIITIQRYELIGLCEEILQCVTVSVCQNMECIFEVVYSGVWEWTERGKVMYWIDAL